MDFQTVKDNVTKLNTKLYEANMDIRVSLDEVNHGYLISFNVLTINERVITMSKTHALNLEIAESIINGLYDTLGF